ncbi:MAG: helix-turn-helix transcriptional regulator [Bernardetiaceae bacterium]|nr:helix-turn-helix transcriptional regulator [Bernardetiaceae bacterium]
MKSEEILKNLKRIREEKGFKQEDISDYLGVSRQTYNKLESGKSELSIQKLEKILAHLNVELSELITQKQENPNKEILEDIRQIKNKIEEIEKKLSNQL